MATKSNWWHQIIPTFARTNYFFLFILDDIITSLWYTEVGNETLIFCSSTRTESILFWNYIYFRHLSRARVRTPPPAWRWSVSGATATSSSDTSTSQPSSGCFWKVRRSNHKSTSWVKTFSPKILKIEPLRHSFWFCFWFLAVWVNEIWQIWHQQFFLTSINIKCFKIDVRRET